MSVRMHILARWYEVRAKMAHDRYVRFTSKAQKIWAALSAGGGR